MFSAAKLQINRGTTTANTQGGDITTVLHTYKDVDLTVAAIILLLPPYLNQGSTQDVIFSGDHILIEGSDTTSFNRIESLDPFTVSIDLFSGASGLSIGPTIAAVDNNAAIITGQILQMENADATHPGIITTAAQAFGGTKTFTAIVAPGTNYTSAAPIGATDTNAIIIDNTAKTIKLENADLTHPGIVSTAAQTFGGVKSFPDGIIAPGATYTAAVPGVATDANAIIINNTANTIELENADLTHPGIVTTAAQSFGGVKTFVGIVAPGTSYTISSPIAPTDTNALIVDNVANTLTLENADATHPGITTAVAQTFGGAKSFSGGVLTNAVDTISAVPLVLGTATATAITLSQNSTVSSGKTLNTNTLDATTAGTLAIGTTTATAITLAKSTTVTAGQLFKANSIDAATAGALSIAPTTATSIALAQNTALAAAKIFTADIIDATTAGALSIAPTTATSVTIAQNTTLSAGKILKADTVDATTAGTLAIGTTTATAITLAKSTTVTAGQLFKANSIDSATAVPLVLAPTTGTAITLSQNTTVSSGKVLNTNFLDATTTGALSIGATTATSISLTQDTTVTAGKLFKANSVDAATASTLRLGITTATDITLFQDTTVSSGKLFKASSIDASTAVPLVLAPTTATAITLSQDTTVTSGKLFKATSIDASTATTLVLAPTTATAITLSQNTTVTAAKTLKADIIDATTSGALTIAPTVATSVKVTPLVMLTSAGMQFSQTTSDVNQSIIKDYVEDTHSSTFTNNTLTTSTIVMTIRRVGKLVTVSVPAGSIASQAAPAFFQMNTVFVSKYRSVNVVYQPIRVINVGGGAEVGLAVLGTDGSFLIYAGMGNSFATGSTIGWSQCSFTYAV